ncbi:MAG: hypothetical protein JWM06_2576 [Actinomycetia bacterium]|nr:hypothetical protein [Actinomycetes bacterium]
MTRDADRLFEEVAFVGYHLGWSLDDILDLEHPLRERFVEEVIGLSRRAG